MSTEDWDANRAELLERGFSNEEINAIDRNEAGIYKLGEDELNTYRETGELPRHPDPDVVVIQRLFKLGNAEVIRWYRQGSN